MSGRCDMHILPNPFFYCPEAWGCSVMFMGSEKGEREGLGPQNRGAGCECPGTSVYSETSPEGQPCLRGKRQGAAQESWERLV